MTRPMAHSLAMCATIPRDHCASTIDAEVWVIVDVEERPDLVDRIRAATLHTFTCGTCGSERRMSASLLVYQPGGRQPLIFSPVKAGSADRHRQEAQSLASELSNRLGDSWRDQWLADGLHVMTCEELASFLTPPYIASLNNRGLAQHERFKRTGDRARLDEAIASFEEALGLLPETWLALCLPG